MIALPVGDDTFVIDAVERFSGEKGASKCGDFMLLQNFENLWLGTASRLDL